jgi:hypothetical protein
MSTAYRCAFCGWLSFDPEMTFCRYDGGEMQLDTSYVAPPSQRKWSFCCTSCRSEIDVTVKPHFLHPHAGQQENPQEIVCCPVCRADKEQINFKCTL